MPQLSRLRQPDSLLLIPWRWPVLSSPQQEEEEEVVLVVVVAFPRVRVPVAS